MEINDETTCGENVLRIKSDRTLMHKQVQKERESGNRKQEPLLLLLVIIFSNDCPTLNTHTLLLGITWSEEWNREDSRGSCEPGKWGGLQDLRGAGSPTEGENGRCGSGRPDLLCIWQADKWQHPSRTERRAHLLWKASHLLLILLEHRKHLQNLYVSPACA